ncbi:MAG: murein biosynthesis integral membrane protein MurJ [Bacillota bacterium]
MKNTARTVGVVMIIMLLSRFLSLLSMIKYTTYFGNTLEINIYSYAIQFPNLVFTIFGTALSTVVIPIFAGSIDTGNKERAFKFADNVISLSVLFTLGLSVLGIILAPLFPLITEFRSNGYDLAVLALRIMFPIMLFYALNYILQGILQSMGRFNMPAFVSVPSSLIVIGYVFLLAPKYGVKGLLIATFIGLSTQALVLIPPIFKTEYRFRPSFDFRSEDMLKAVKLMIPVMIGTSAYQLNMFFNVTLTANFKNTVTIFSIVQNLVLYAVLAFIYSITAVVFPKFTMLAARGDMDEFKNSLVKVLTSITYFLIPATVGFILVRKELINLIVGWGKITPGDVTLASTILALYAAGITGVGIKELVDRAFYSLKDTRRPAIIGIIVMGVNIAVSLILTRFIGVYGIPVGNSVSTLAGAFVLMFLLRRKIGSFGASKFVGSTLRIASASLLMAIVLIPVTLVMAKYTFGFALLDRSIKLFIPAALGALVYFASTYVLKVGEAVEVLDKVRSRLGFVK